MKQSNHTIRANHTRIAQVERLAPYPYNLYHRINRAQHNASRTARKRFDKHREMIRIMTVEQAIERMAMMESEIKWEGWLEGTALTHARDLS